MGLGVDSGWADSVGEHWLPTNRVINAFEEPPCAIRASSCVKGQTTQTSLAQIYTRARARASRQWRQRTGGCRLVGLDKDLLPFSLGWSRRSSVRNHHNRINISRPSSYILWIFFFLNSCRLLSYLCHYYKERQLHIDQTFYVGSTRSDLSIPGIGRIHDQSTGGWRKRYQKWVKNPFK